MADGEIKSYNKVILQLSSGEFFNYWQNSVPKESNAMIILINLF